MWLCSPRVATERNSWFENLIDFIPRYTCRFQKHDQILCAAKDDTLQIVHKIFTVLVEKVRSSAAAFASSDISDHKIHQEIQGSMVA